MAVLCAVGAVPVPAQTQLSDAIAAYRTGEHESAFQQFRALAEKGNPIAQFNLGVMYLHGQGTRRDPALAAAWHRRAAERGVAAAQYGLGVMFVRGEGVGQDFSQAAHWFRAAARQDYPDAQYNLGVMYLEGQGVAQDMVQAVKWISLAAARGHPDAMYRLGLMHETGEPFDRDPDEAGRWYGKAAAREHDAAGRRLAALGKGASAAGAAASARTGPPRPAAAIDQYDRPAAAPAATEPPPARSVARSAAARPAENGPAPHPAPKPARNPGATVAPKPAFVAPPVPRSRPGWTVQVGSFPTRSEAGRAWAALRQRFGDLFVGLSPRVDRAAVRDRGVFHRLRLGPLENRAAAVQLCKDLLVRAHGHGCLPIPPRSG